MQIASVVSGRCSGAGKSGAWLVWGGQALHVKSRHRFGLRERLERRVQQLSRSGSGHWPSMSSAFGRGFLEPEYSTYLLSEDFIDARPGMELYVPK